MKICPRTQVVHLYAQLSVTFSVIDREPKEEVSLEEGQV